MQRRQYFADDSPADREEVRLQALEAMCDGTTTRRLDALGVAAGWRCLEVAAGRGSIARWLARQVGPSGRVVATDLNPRFLRGAELPGNIEVREHDVLEHDFEPQAYNVVHARALLVHMPEPERTVARLAAAVRPGGWLLIEEADFSMFRASDAHYPGADAFDRSVRRLLDAIRSAGIWDGCLGHRTPLFVERLGFDRTGYDCVPFMGSGGDDPAGRFWSLTFPLSGPALVNAGTVHPGRPRPRAGLPRRPRLPLHSRRPVRRLGPPAVTREAVTPARPAAAGSCPTRRETTPEPGS